MDFAAFVLDRGDGILAGSAFVTVASDLPDHAEVFQMWLDDDLRGGGWADLLLDTAVRFALALGSRTTRLWVYAENGRARRFYERAGYLPTGVEQLGPQGSFLHLLRKNLSPPPTPGPEPLA